ncbi:hypothetical protein TRFO_12720 [Tritrichomonas foetus]|uniref:Uncharacterized protein n=1 Tax=Tritrichomonas foetus TaxID=1144522 RepID=A0A1J4L1S5_9EUKA|nr:hypothetical protein TRFO_12720 [Tritrichomonas foetus]|eukprot:OHT17024.1 hypothetical protein TRFO_12720 [Tritrichomonas foetus]
MIELHQVSNLNGNINEELQKIIKITEKSVPQGQIDFKQWNEFASNYNGKIEVHHHVCLHDSPWTWKYVGRYIELNIQRCKLSQIQITENSIKSPSINGKWWCQISQISSTENETDGSVNVKFLPSKKMPVLITLDANSDPLSIFYIAVFCMMTKNQNFLDFFTYAAKLGQIDAQIYLWKFYNQCGNNELTIYWLATAVFQHFDEKSTIVLAQTLINKNSPLKSIPLAECLLLKLLQNYSNLHKEETDQSFDGNPEKNEDSSNEPTCEMKNEIKNEKIKVIIQNFDGIDVDIFLTLGKLYLLDDEAAPNCTDLGLKLNEIAVELMKLPEAEQTLNEYRNNIFWSGVSYVDLAVVTGILAAFGVGAYLWFKKRRNNQK